MPPVQIPAAFIEHIHDVLVGIFLPFDETVNPAEHRNRGAIEAALGRPYQTVGGEDAYPTVSQKAAALFHSLICNHCFINGNKRTAVIALDMFVMTHYYVLAMSSDEMYELAKETAQANQEGRPLETFMEDLASKIEVSIISVSLLDDADIKEKLGQNFTRVMKHIKRALNFAVTSMETYTKEPLDRKAVDEFMAKYPD